MVRHLLRWVYLRLAGVAVAQQTPTLLSAARAVAAVGLALPAQLVVLLELPGKVMLAVLVYTYQPRTLLRAAVVVAVLLALVTPPIGAVTEVAAQTTLCEQDQTLLTLAVVAVVDRLTEERTVVTAALAVADLEQAQTAQAQQPAVQT
jgi:hypothetical protein